MSSGRPIEEAGDMLDEEARDRANKRRRAISYRATNSPGQPRMIVRPDEVEKPETRLSRHGGLHEMLNLLDEELVKAGEQHATHRDIAMGTEIGE